MSLETSKLKGIERKIQIPFIIVVTLFFILELINIIYGFRFFPILILEVFIGLYLVKEIIKYLIKKYKEKKTKENITENGKDSQSKIKDIMNNSSAKEKGKDEQENTNAKIGQIIDNIILIIKIIIKPIITIFITLLIFDSIGNMGKVSEISEIDLEGNVYECTNLIGDGGACLVGVGDNEDDWVTVIFGSDGNVQYLVEGNELR